MEHKEYISEIPGCHTVVLFIHGISGSPNQFSFIAESFKGRFSVYNILLDGHGSDVLSFGKSSMAKWISQVLSAVQSLERKYENIILVGHSMGCLLAAEAFLSYPDKIKKMIWLAVPLKIFIRPKAVLNSYKIKFGCVQPDDAVGNAGIACNSIGKHRSVFEYLTWVPRYLELLAEAHKIRKYIAQITVPTTVFLSQNDELVSIQSRRYLKGNPFMEAIELSDSGHFYYTQEEKKNILAKTDALLKGLL